MSSTLKTRSLDYLRQTLIFNHVYKNTDYFKNVKYLLVDDADEMTPVCFDFIRYLKPQLKDWVICFDALGSSRCGYLSADTSIECKLVHLFNEEVIDELPQTHVVMQKSIAHNSPLVGESESLIPVRGQEQESLKARHFYTKEALEHSKELRKNSTPAEQILWYYLRNKQLNGLKFRRQEAFGNYILDFVCYEKKLVIELDGGGHLEEKQKQHDEIRDKFIIDNGYQVLRIFNNEIFNNIEGVIEEILNKVDIQPLPLTPSHKGRGDALACCKNINIDCDVKQKSVAHNSPLVGESESPIPERCYEDITKAKNSTHYSPFTTHSQNTFPQGEIIFSNILENKRERLENFTLTSLSKRAEILDFTIEKIKNLFKKNVKPKDITIITPLQDNMLKFTLEENLKHICNPLFLSGSEKLIDNPLVKASLNILKLMLGIDITEMELRVILSDFLRIPLKYCDGVLAGYKSLGTLPKITLEFYDEKYQKFLKVFEEIKEKDERLSLRVYELFYKLVEHAEGSKINKFNFFIKQLRDFESVLGEKTVIERADEIIVQIENSIIAENPSTILEFGDDDLVVATPQKIIDNKISSKYQFWLDVSHSDWVKTDTGPLYNAWVFQADWTKDEYTVEDDIFLAKQKTARILRKLLLLASDHIWACSSLFDPAGVENLGGIEEYLAGSTPSPTLPEGEGAIAFKIIPRADQKPVLDYKSGSMAISAVPGAGKTTILLALIIKLINQGVTPSNIFVLTYMDSAARNFRERIKNMCPNSTQLPNISTIHGLALKIIKENANYERLNLDSDFDICDDTQRMRIIKSIAGKFTKIESDEFDRAISVIKLQEGNIDTPSSDKKIEKFKNFYREYQAKLREENLIDYDDILIMSVKLLENNPDILEYYQNICEYIIEDEAQDSSGVQQRLIALLSGKYKNLVRCGDINQAITTTFSNADVEGFRQFIKTADKTVEMNHSQRCTQDVMTLANNLVNYGNEILPKAFFTSYMQGVEGKNPVSENAIFSRVFENAFAERNFILKEIKNILTRNKDATIGILLRNNYQVTSWAGFINDAGLKSITRSESLGQKGVFNTIFAILKFIQNPFDNEVVVSTYETLSDLGFYRQRLQLEIRASEKPFIQKDGDDIESNDLAQFLWDMQYWLNSSTLPLEELVIRIGLFYYTSDIEKSNVYLIATLVKRLSSNAKFDLVLQRLEEISKKPTLSGFKFFSEEEDKDAMKGKVQIMTLHKSKGDEFEYVFLPEMAEKNLSIDVEKAKTKSSIIFMEEVRGFNPHYKKKSELELREFNSEESLRLLYVAITRAQKKLYITTSAKAKGWGNKETEQEPSVIFEHVL